MGVGLLCPSLSLPPPLSLKERWQHAELSSGLDVRSYMLTILGKDRTLGFNQPTALTLFQAFQTHHC